MKYKGRFLLIQGTIFPFDTLITTACLDDVIKYIEENKKYKLSDKERDNLEMSGNGRTVMLIGGQTIIRIKTQRTTIGIDLVDLAHEIEHAVYFIMDRIGVVHNDGSDEVFAYYQGYLMRKALEFFDKPKKKKK